MTDPICPIMFAEPSSSSNFNLHPNQTSMSDLHLCFCLQPTPKQQILNSSKLKEFGANIYKFDENGRKFSKWIENSSPNG